MTLSYVLGKGRASNPQLLAIARKWACISMAGDLMLVHRWIPSEYNVADRDSRRWEENHMLCETADTPCSSDLKPMIGEPDAPLSPLVEDASSWIEFCSQQIPKTWRQKPKKRREQGVPTHRLVRWENADEWRNTNGPRNDGAERTNLSAGSAYLSHDPSESSGRESACTEPPREQRSRARNHGQLPEGRHGFRAVCLGDRGTSGLGEWCGDRGDMPGIPGPLVHPGLRARSRKSVDGSHPDYFSPATAVMEISTCQGQ